MNFAPVVAILFLAATGSGQQCASGEPSATGAVAVVPGDCPGGTPPAGMTCIRVRVDCASIPSIDCALRMAEPHFGTALRGTVVLGTGGGGTGFYGERPGGPELIDTLRTRGFRVVDRAWTRGWFSDAVSVRKQSCRYATLLTWLHSNVHTSGAFCATGNSGGSAELCYALTSWNADTWLDVAVPTGGPPMARLDFLCTNPPSAQWQQLCVQVIPPHGLECGQPDCTLQSHQVCIACGGAAATPADQRADSILHPSAVLAYPTTRVHQVIGAMDCTSAVPNGLVFHEAVTSEKVLEFAPGAPHWTANNQAGRDAIVRALLGGVACAGTIGTLAVDDWPQVGGTLDFSVHGPALGAFAIALGFSTTMLEAPGIGWLFVAPPHVPVGVGSLDGAGRGSLSWPFPNDPMLTGLVLFEQGIAGSCVTNIARAEVLP